MRFYAIELYVFIYHIFFKLMTIYDKKYIDAGKY